MSTTALHTSNIIKAASILELQAKRLSRDLVLGQHDSTRLGSGLEFDQYRAYAQGDDLRLLDWKMYAKTNKYYVKRSRITGRQNLHVHFDSSKSMNYQEEGKSKFQLCKMITATLSYIMMRQNDSFSWSTKSSVSPNKNGRSQWLHSLQELELLQANETISEAPTFKKDKSIQIWICDTYCKLDDLEQQLKSSIHPQSDLTCIHLLGIKERDLDFDGNTTFRDLESQEEIQVNARQYADTYRSQLNQHINRFRSICNKKGILYYQFMMHEDIAVFINRLVTNYNYSR